MHVNEEAEGVQALHARIRALEEALSPFLSSQYGYTSSVRHGVRWCSPRVTQEDMERARKLVGA